MLHGIITQNVDGLHQAAGARDVVELHGGLDRVVCLECGARSTREALDQRLRAANPDLDWDKGAASNPDGDAELAEEQVARFRLVGCECCGSDMLKPDVVFFGENVPRSRVQGCFELLDGSASLLVLGSSLMVMSGLRFVHRPSLSTSGETLTIEESMNLEGENGERQDVGDVEEWSCGWSRRPRSGASRRRATFRGRRARRPGGVPDPELVEQAKRRSFTAEYKARISPRPTRAPGRVRSASCFVVRACTRRT